MSEVLAFIIGIDFGLILGFAITYFTFVRPLAQRADRQDERIKQLQDALDEADEDA